jgi:hypothetical protein
MFRRQSFLMSPDPAPASATPPATPPAPAAGEPTPGAPPAPLPPDVQARELAEARKDAAAYREKLRKREAEDEEKAKALLAEQGKHKELYEAEAKRAKELADKVTAYEAAQRTRADAALAQIPEHLRAFAPADPVKAEEYASTILKSLQPAPGAPPAPRPTTAPAAPAPVPPATTGEPPKPTAAEMQESSYTRDPKRKAELEAKINAWQKSQRGK